MKLFGWKIFEKRNLNELSNLKSAREALNMEGQRLLISIGQINLREE